MLLLLRRRKKGGTGDPYKMPFRLLEEEEEKIGDYRDEEIRKREQLYRGN
jgi:hypothetical protein